MAYNKAREERKWKLWKEREEKILRELGMDEKAILALRKSDWERFNEERRFREHEIPLEEYMKLPMKETDPQIRSMKGLLDSIGNEQLFHILSKADRKTLQILVFKMMGYKPREIGQYLNMPEQTVYTKLRRLRKKIKKIVEGE